ncbi:MAG: hypothetical protein WBA17_08695 [Saprospiraceae bacterium]
MRYFFTCCLIFAATIAVSAQEKVPTIFQLSDVEKLNAQLQEQYPQDFFTAVDNDFGRAEGIYLEVMKSVDAFARSINYDIDGMKVWIQFFIGTDGSIQHLGFQLRPESRNMDVSEIKAFFKAYIEKNRFPLTADQPFNYYTRATFPTIARRAD